jgi:TonB-linked SusC/RagA family outer membrane protein
MKKLLLLLKRRDTVKQIRIALLLMTGLFASQVAMAQSQISGRVLSGEDQSPMPGVNIVVKGTTNGTISDANGAYSLLVNSPDAILLFSFVGFNTQEVSLNGRTTIDISMATDAKQLSEVVVTALGIEKDKKAVGYATQSVQGLQLTQARETNLISGLAGKIAGVNIVNNPSGIGSSSRITIRGERSLNINNNQPLFIVDGVPISNSFTGSSGGPAGRNQDVDYGNGAGFVNPDDIESMTVLKGGSAAALYGSRASNGVIIIKTKSGKGTKGLGVSINSTTSFESVLILPEYQNQYGQGLNGEFNFVDGNGSGNKDGVDESWGPSFNGQSLDQFDSPTSIGFRGGDVGNLFPALGVVDLNAQLQKRGTISATPWIAYPDNVKDFFQTGVTSTNNIAVTSSSDKGSFRMSYTYLDQKGFVPNTDLKRNTFAVNAGYKLSEKLKVNAVVNYIDNKSGNRPSLSYGTENIMYLFNNWFSPSQNIASLRNYWQAGREGLNQFNFNYNYHDNPYFNIYENTNGQQINRVFGNFSATYQFTDWLSLTLRGGTDYSNEFRDRKRAYSTQRYLRGSYREEKVVIQETNTDFLLNAAKDFGTDISFSASLGGNLLKQTRNSSDISAPELAVPGIYSLGNSRVALQASSFRSEKRINSLYASSQLGYKNMIFIDLSARNDWSSSLPSDNWSYFYPAANVSAVLSDIFKIETASLSFLKARVGVARVGNDTDPYQLISAFTAQTAVKGTPSYSESSVLANAQLKPEISNSFETGFEARFLDDRIGIDFTFYQNNSRNQILPIPLSNTTGYSARIINAGLIQNWGTEIMLSLTPIRRTNGFRWDINVNHSINRSEVKELYTDPISGQEITNYVLASRYVTVEARVGERMGNMYGIGYQRVSADPTSKYFDPTGQFVGQVVYNSTGKPIATSERILLGNYNSDWQAGITNKFSFKGVSLSVLIDHRQGGSIYSHTQTVGREGGRIIETLEGRANGYDLSLPGNGVIGDGVVATFGTDGKATSFAPNATKLSAREWHSTITLGRSLIEPVIYDATFTKLREVILGYTIPNKVFGAKFPIRDLNISFVGRNLFLWSKVPHVDPETSSTVGGTIIPGVESTAIPSTRSYGFNINFKL